MLRASGERHASCRNDPGPGAIWYTTEGFILHSIRAPRRPSRRVAWESRFSRPSDLEFRRLLEKLPAAAYTCDADGLITYFNERAVEFWGREPVLNDPVDRFCGSFRLFASDGTPITHDLCWMALALRNDRSYDGEEIIVERPDGTRLTALAHANPIHDESGKVVGAVNVLVDISDRKQAEVMLRETDRSKNEFLAMLAHELRNPLAPMHNALRIMRIAADDATAVDQARGTLERQLAHLTRVVDDLLDLSRITRNTLELRMERVELGSVIEEAVDTCRPVAEATGHEIEVEIRDGPMELNADPVRLAQLVNNLLTNACRYTDSKGTIRLLAERQGSDAVLAVIDTGIGIEPDALPAVFEMFRRGDGSREQSQDGLGIGLTLSRRIAELHGGTLDAFSEGAGTGSRFTVRLPLILGRIDADPPETTDPPQASSASSRRVLVVDDNVDSASSLGDLLELTGHETRMAHDGQEALAIAAEWRPDAVLLDIGLPRMSGYEVARELRAQEWGKGLLLVALTGWGQEEDRAKSREAGLDHHLVKPVDFNVLSELLAERAPAREA